MSEVNWNAVISSLFVPLLGWVIAVITVALLGYPGVICMTPAAWILAIPVGQRVFRESQSPLAGRIREAALGGGLLGLCQGLLLAGVLAAAPSLLVKMPVSLPGAPILSLLGVAASSAVTAGISALMVMVMARRR